ncbi:DUF4255 domain-containing protein [Burkholderia sp. MS455]|uniref:DUF4255 domain-containing protein n=1 Tax=Burkholderia sp. MS455 TaxID=2811788 RepID=UPI00195BBA1D|nr:DUF4255 domain-containing protein [Burkholderia sp. MS455]QRR07645.1 DUF4255 domain-containing protein [Burkholderia sp. MS455]
MGQGKMNAKSDGTLIFLNKGIEDALTKYIDGTIKIRFDMVDKENLPNDPTICVFLYDIQEDLELRHGQPRAYQASVHQLAPRRVHMRCCYLLTYWEQSKPTPVPYDGQPVQVMNTALNGLLNMRLEHLPAAYVQVVAPSEHLSSLGNFWQSLGDKPRLCLNFTVTIPIELGLDHEDTVPPVMSTELDETDPPPEGWEDLDKALHFKREWVTAMLKACPATQTDWNSVRAQLARLQVTCAYVDDKGAPLPKPAINLSGGLDSKLFPLVGSTVTSVAEQMSVTVVSTNLYEVKVIQ